MQLSYSVFCQIYAEYGDLRTRILINFSIQHKYGEKKELKIFVFELYLCYELTSLNLWNYFIFIKITDQKNQRLLLYHCVKNFGIRNFSWAIFSCIRTEFRDLQSMSPHTWKNKTGRTPSLGAFQAS